MPDDQKKQTERDERHLTAATAGKMPLRAAISQLYGYIYCMLISNILVGMPLFGGVLYLCGKAVLVTVQVFSRKNRKYLPLYSRVWVILLITILMLIGFLLTGIYPARFESEKLWIMYAAVALCLCCEGMAGRMRRLSAESGGPMSDRAWVLTILMQAAFTGAMAVVLITQLGWNDGWPPAAGFALMAAACTVTLGRGDIPGGDAEGTEEEVCGIHAVKAYHAMEWISLLIVMAVELTMTAIYALLATNREWILPAVAVAAVCTVVPAEIGYRLLRHSERKGRRDPTWMTVAGLLIWAAAIVQCSHMMRAGSLDYIMVYVCLALCTLGGTLSLTGLHRIEEIMPDAVSAAGQAIPAGYWRMRIANWDLARLLGDVLAIIGLSIFCFATGGDLPRNMEDAAARFQPVMMIPVILVIIAALVCVLRFPLGSRALRKLRTFLRMQEAGTESPALRRELEQVVTKPCRQTYLARFLILILRPVFHHRLVNEENLKPDINNPVVFLCNHGEFYGPIICNLFLPVPIRSWTISMMMFDQKEVTAYVYENTFVRLTYLPVFVRKAMARFIGWLSVTVMNQIESIPVYRDSPLKLRETVRLSIDAMEAGDNVLIFPENPSHKYESEGIGELSPGFVMLAEAYWKKKNKKLRMLPIYANKNEKTITFGTEIVYDPDAGYGAEQDRIVNEATRQIRAMAGMPENGDKQEGAV